MSHKNYRRLSKFMSLVLRHQPDLIGLDMDAQGWVKVDALLSGMRKKGHRIDRKLLEEVVANNDKKRFAFDETGELIRANQGHSIKIELGYQPSEPPEILYHGTAKKFLNSIYATGLQKRSRHHVHLSADTTTAFKVGNRHGYPVIFEVLAQEMHAAGMEFFVSDNGVWLTDSVPAEYLRLKEEGTY